MRSSLSFDLILRPAWLCADRDKGALSQRFARRVFAAVSISLASAFLAPSPTLADKSQPIAERRAVYAPWNPQDMAQRRREYGLVGPGPQRPVPPPAFPSFHHPHSPPAQYSGLTIHPLTSAGE